MTSCSNLIKDIEAYQPVNDQEARDKALIVHALKHAENIFSRENALAHMTASAWVVNPDRTKALMAYHRIYDSWAWLGGHADGEEDLLAVALREVREESGVTRLRAVSPAIFSLECLTVDGHEKRGQYVSSHLHLNVTYLIEADDRDPVFIKADENKAVAWFSPEEAIAASTEPWFKQRIYRKLVDKVNAAATEKDIL